MYLSISYCRDYLTTVLSCIYAVFILTLGLVIYITDVIVGNSPVAEVCTLTKTQILYSLKAISVFLFRRLACTW